MRIKGEIGDESTTATTSPVSPVPTAAIGSDEATTKVLPEPVLPNREENERLIGRSGSSTERRTNTPPVLVRLNRRKDQAHVEAKQRCDAVEQARDGNEAALERETVKRELFEKFAAGQFVRGIMDGWGRQQRALQQAGEEQIEGKYDEFQYHDDRVRWEHEVLREGEAEAAKVDRDQQQEAAVEERIVGREVEVRTAEERWSEQRAIEQEVIEERVRQERDSIEARSGARDRVRSRGGDGPEDERWADEAYYEHNRNLDRER